MELKLALIHAAVSYKEPEKNKKELLSHLLVAAKKGANILVAPEMAVSGYSFASRADIGQYVVGRKDPFCLEIAGIAEEYGCYICIGLALMAPETGSYTNSAMVFGPKGFSFRYDKINGEIRWARPGDPRQHCCFDTPWGRVGVLICSDTYYELQPRVVALQGADLLLVPSNWPPSGLDPVELWRMRAMENGIAVAVCNRTGEDLNMSCSKARSCLIGDDGKLLLCSSSPTTTVFTASLPLFGGRLSQKRRKSRLAGRRPGDYHGCYRPINIVGDLSSFLALPPPGLIRLGCLVEKMDGGEDNAELLAEHLKKHQDSALDQQEGEVTAALWLVAYKGERGPSHSRLIALAREYGCYIFLCEKKDYHLFEPGGQIHDQKALAPEKDAVFKELDMGPARVALMPYAALIHPENTVAVSKGGCDLVLLLHHRFDDEIALFCGARSISHLCLATVCADGGGIWMRPEGHARWEEQRLADDGHCSYLLDTHLTRKKRFQDRVDFDILLK